MYAFHGIVDIRPRFRLRPLPLQRHLHMNSTTLRYTRSVRLKSRRPNTHTHNTQPLHPSPRCTHTQYLNTLTSVSCNKLGPDETRVVMTTPEA